MFPFLLAISALALAGAAAFFSVTGLSKLFGGAPTEVAIMASALEFSKIVTASFLHRYWKELKWQLKTWLTIGVVTVMIITSAGIYGFLSNAYAMTSGKLQNVESKIHMIEQKKEIIGSAITSLKENKALKSDRIKSLTTLRSQQESRVDSLYNRRQNSVAKRVESQIEQSDLEIKNERIESDSIDNKIQRKFTEISGLELQISEIKNGDINSEVGPLKYIAKLTGKDMDSVVNFFIFMLIFVFDPLAISLVIATNMAFEKELGAGLSEKEKTEEPFEPQGKFIGNGYSASHAEGIEQKNKEETHNEEMSDEEKGEKVSEVIQYVADEKGEFKPIPETTTIQLSEVVQSPIAPVEDKVKKAVLDQIKIEGIKHNASYMSFLDVLFQKGTVKAGGLLPRYEKFIEDIKAAGIAYVEKDIKDFLTICNLFKITDMSDPEKKQVYKIAKDYSVAKEIISLLSK